MNPGLPPPHHAALSRTNSAMSFSSTSEDDASLASSTGTVINTSRRTRKRFTNVQLTMLENLFHQNSHPSREEREAVAKAGAMEIKSVTIWFQNKRQTERKTAASNSGQGNTFNEANVQPNITSTIHTFSLHNDTHSTYRTASPPFSASSRSSGGGGYAVPSHHQHHHQATTATTASSAGALSSSSRPSLDRVASRTELRNAPPRTPSSRRANTSGQIYDNMPSSPLGPPISPPSRDFIDFGKNAKTRRTLEWACAAARVSDKDTTSSTSSSGEAVQQHLHKHHHQTSASTEASGAHGHKNRGRTVHRERSQSTIGGGGGGSASGRHHHHHHHHGHHTHHTSSSSHRHSSSAHRSSSSRKDRLSRSSSSLTLRAESSMSSVSSSSFHMDVDYNTDSEEDHEAVTPPSTWGKGDMRWATSVAREGSSASIMSLTEAAAAAAAAEVVLPKGADDEDMFKAALALCGLGRR